MIGSFLGYSHLGWQDWTVVSQFVDYPSRPLWLLASSLRGSCYSHRSALQYYLIFFLLVDFNTLSLFSRFGVLIIIVLWGNSCQSNLSGILYMTYSLIGTSLFRLWQYSLWFCGKHFL